MAPGVVALGLLFQTMDMKTKATNLKTEAWTVLNQSDSSDPEEEDESGHADEDADEEADAGVTDWDGEEHPSDEQYAQGVSSAAETGSFRMFMPTDGSLYLKRHSRWAAYVWDFFERSITLLDPYLQYTSVRNLQWEHDEIIDCLHEALFDCKDAWMPWWEVDRHNWDYKHPIALGKRCRDYNTGVYAMHYALWFSSGDLHCDAA